MKTLPRFAAVAFAVLAAIGATMSSVHAQAWPTRPVKIIVTFGAGGTADTLGRIIATELSKEFGQQFIIENKPGSSGAIGSSFVAGAGADGYTLMVAGAGPQLVGPAVNSKITYDTMRDFTHIAMIAGDSFMLAATPSLGVKNFADFKKVASAGPVTCGSPGAGSQGHLLQEIINRAAGFKLQPVPFRGAAGAMTALIGGHIQSALQPAISVAQHAKAGKVVALAVTSQERLDAYKEVPTLKELGYDIRGTAWFWLAGPSKLPAEIVGKLNAAMRRIVGSEAIRAQFAKSALSTLALDQAQTTAFIAEEVKLWGTTARNVGLKVQ
jgi:tripartite-type tricarboxylate transporter receptor subunit TctC